MAKKFRSGIEEIRSVYLQSDKRKPVEKEQAELRANVHKSLEPEDKREDARIARDHVASFHEVDRQSQAGLPAKGRMGADEINSGLYELQRGNTLGSSFFDSKGSEKEARDAGVIVAGGHREGRDPKPEKSE